MNNVNFLLLGLDRVVDFATLGEYRVLSGEVVFGNDDTAHVGANADAKQVPDSEIWATDIEWSSTSRDRGKCTLPRARDRKLARERVRG